MLGVALAEGDLFEFSEGDVAWGGTGAFAGALSDGAVDVGALLFEDDCSRCDENRVHAKIAPISRITRTAMAAIPKRDLIFPPMAAAT